MPALTSRIHHYGGARIDLQHVMVNPCHGGSVYNSAMRIFDDLPSPISYLFKRITLIFHFSNHA